MPTLVLSLVGPQSWGISSFFKHRDTGMEPSKSGVYGLIEAALGLDRSETYPPLEGLRFGVRIDRPGHWEVDLQTAESVAMANGKGHKNEIFWKSYLADAHFMVALEGDQIVLETIQNALQRPKRPVYLGRRAFSPTCSLILPDSLQPELLETTLTTYPWCAGHLFTWPFHPPGELLRGVIDDENGYEIRYDVRVGSPASHEYTSRRVRTNWVQPVLASSAVTLTDQSSQDEMRPVPISASTVSEKAPERTPGVVKPPQLSTVVYETQIIFENPIFDPDDLNVIHNIIVDLWSLKGSQKNIPVLFRLDKAENDTFSLVVRCPQKPDQSQMGQFEVVKVVSELFQVPPLSPGDRFRFEILVNPTQKRNGKKFGLKEPEEQVKWFRKKAAQRGGFQILEITRHLQRPQLVKRDDREIFFTGAIFEGIGEVADDALFERGLWQGLAASGKFAGFNMLQILEYPV